MLTPLFMAPFENLKEGMARKLLLFFMASAAATVATALPVAYYFHRVSVTGLISNFFIVPLMGYGAVVVGFSALPFFAVLPAVAKPLLTIAALLVKVSNGIIMVLAKLPVIPFHNPSRLDLMLFYLLLSSLTFISHKRARLACSSTVACLCFGSLVMPPGHGNGGVTITMFSIGQGE